MFHIHNQIMLWVRRFKPANEVLLEEITIELFTDYKKKLCKYSVEIALVS